MTQDNIRFYTFIEQLSAKDSESIHVILKHHPEYDLMGYSEKLGAIVAGCEREGVTAFIDARIKKAEECEDANRTLDIWADTLDAFKDRKAPRKRIREVERMVSWASERCASLNA